MTAPAAFHELKARLAEISDLSGVSRLLLWDQQTKMPIAGSAARAEQSATVTRLQHELSSADEVGRLLDELTPWAESLDADSDEASVVRVAGRDWEKARRVPAELTAELRREGALGLRVWAEARPRSDFELLRPSLERILELRRRYVDCFEDYDDAYDVLLDDFEPGMKAAEVQAVFDRVKEGLRPLIAAAEPVDDSILHQAFPIEAQERFSHEMLERFGYEEDSWRLDVTAHPFMSNPATTDVRVTTHYHPDSLHSLFSTMHEFGHGVYERDVDPALDRTTLGTGVSLGLHESQSRMWENLVGRGRPFWRFFYPRLQSAFQEQLGSVDEQEFVRAVNRVEPSLIRIDADEVTYSMHVILRFELEQELIEGRLAPRDLPAAWNERMESLLGVTPPTDADGVLQDMHWAGGLVGYFPTYALGSVMSVQIWERMTEDMPDVDAQIERGEFGELRGWLREHLYRHGRKFSPQETLRRAVGGPIDPEPYLRYLAGKHAA